MNKDGVTPDEDEHISGVALGAASRYRVCYFLSLVCQKKEKRKAAFSG
jgi:hypothetical protein